MAERPKISFDLNVPAEFTAKFDSARKSGENNGSNWYLWTVEVDSEDWSLFADDALNDLLTYAQLKRGDAVAVTKIKRGKEPWYWEVQVNGFPIQQPAQQPAANDRQQPAQHAANGQSTNGNSNGSAPKETPSLDELAALMENCLFLSDAAWTQLHHQTGCEYTPDHIKGTASTLFIQAVSQGIKPKHPAAVARENIQRRQGVPADIDEPPEWMQEGPPPSDDGLPF